MAERRGPAAADEFPAGMRVLAVDDNPVCLKLMEATLRFCKYHATVTNDAEKALQMLRERPEDFDLVISDVHTTGDMDGFRLLELIGLEMDLPVIMISASTELNIIMEGLAHGACDYMVKPVTAMSLKNIWQHVVRNSHRGDNNGAHQNVQPGSAMGVQVGATGTRKYPRKKRSNGHIYDWNKENMGFPRQKKPRVSWSTHLHKLFLRAVNQLGVDRAAPKKIWQMMNVDYITRDNVSSHLQKYRLYLKRLTNHACKLSEKSSDASAGWDYVNELQRLHNYNEHGRYKLSPGIASSNPSNLSARMNSASALGTYGFLPAQSVHQKGQSNLGSMGAVGHGGCLLEHAVQNSSNSMLPNAGKCSPSCLPGANHLVLDTSNGFLSGYFVNSSMDKSSDKTLETSKGFPSCHSGNSLANKSNVGVLAPATANQFLLQSPELSNQPLVQMNSSSEDLFSTLGNDCHFPDLGNCSDSWQTTVPSEFPDLGHEDGTSLDLPQVTIPDINQSESFAASHGQMPMFGSELHDQMSPIMSNDTWVADFSEHMWPFNIGNNIGSTEVLHDSFALGSASNISSTMPTDSRISFPNLEMDSSAVPTHMLNVGDEDGILPVLDDTVNQQAFFDQPDDSNGFLTGTLDGIGDLSDIVAGLLNCQDFMESEDAFGNQGFVPEPPTM